MILLLATVPILLLFALFFLDIYVFRSQWKDEPQDDGAQTVHQHTAQQKPARRKAQHAAPVR
jgi:hypothetical protein